MASLQVHLTVGQHASTPHMPCTLDPQMRVFFQRNLDPFDGSLSMTDFLRATGNLLSVVRSSLSWASQLLAAPSSPQPDRRRSKAGKENGEENAPSPAAEERGTDCASKSRSGPEPKAAASAREDSPTEERVRRTQEAGRAATAEAKERLRRARKEKGAEPAAASELPCGSRPHGLHLAIELSVHGEREEGAGTNSSGSGPNCPPSFRGSLSVHFPPSPSGASRRGGREGR
ncbi:hypothetical protein [Methylacidimicrobium sp. B4]|uniref:hypothetical protein n=1 Tax=Methylacidimicrobium sp. B4 TaxID=2796139 RepID=UPI001A8C9B57|nr:hypothetical protein [Methylacidimicrobium sp. B4]QSR84946.1 hypothetical protein MacB4_01335 [Methylacidimicrobium sp. B4]